MRYFLHLSYLGTPFHGWQRQPNGASVQQTIEETLAVLLREDITVLGCGRTDAGVHARQFYLHFDFSNPLPDHFLHRLNKLLPPSIAVYDIREVAADAHARFDAVRRSYAYHLSFRKDPFGQNTVHFYPFADRPDPARMQEAAELLLNYEEFFPFCKTNTDVKTMRCALERSEWVFADDGLSAVYHVSADRFLRGMVRLIVGMCIRVGTGKVALGKVKKALDDQSRLEESWSAPPEGLFLTEVSYPYIQ